MPARNVIASYGEAGPEVCQPVFNYTTGRWDFVATRWLKNPDRGDVLLFRNQGGGVFDHQQIADGLTWARDVRPTGPFLSERGGFVVSGWKSGHWFFRREASGTFTQILLESTPDFGAMMCLTHDLDGDGYLDMITCTERVGATGNPWGYVRLYRNNQDGTLTLMQTIMSIDKPTGAVVTDLDLDGRPEIVVAASNGSYYFKFNNWATPGPYEVLYTGGSVESLIASDLDNDGREEIVLAGVSGLRVVHPASLGQGLTLDPGPRYYAAAADLNHDGLKEIVAVSLDRPSNPPEFDTSIYWQGPLGVWTREIIDSGNGEGGRGVCLADWLGNGKLHPIVTCFSAGNILRWGLP